MRRKSAVVFSGLLALSGLGIMLFACQSELDPAPVSTSTPTPDPLALARQWVNENTPVLVGELVELVLGSDLGFGALDVHIRDLVREDVTEQLTVGLDASFALDASDWRKVLVTLTGVVEVVTDSAEVLGGLAEVPAVKGSIEVTQPFIATLRNDTEFDWERVEDELEISVDLTASE